MIPMVSYENQGSASVDYPPMMGDQKVSIVISNHNYERYVSRAIESSLNQTYSNLEVIVVDDGSSDRSWEMICKYADHSCLRTIRQENAGQAAAINKGFKESNGEIVIFLDSDDELRPDAVRKIVENWRAGISRIQFPLEVIDQDGKRLGLHPFGREMEDGDAHWRLTVAGVSKFSPTSGNAFSRSALQLVMPIPAKEWRICADTYVVMMTTKSGPVANIRLPLGYYRIHGQNSWYTATRHDEKARLIWRNHVQAWRTFVHHIQPNGPAHLTREIRSAAVMYQYRRIIMAQSELPDVFLRAERRRSLVDALWKLTWAKIPVRNKILYLSFLLAVAAQAWNNRRLRGWIVHRNYRPFFINWLIDLLKGKDFYRWMSAREFPQEIRAVQLGKRLRFGAAGEARSYQWYGWSRAGQVVDWCIGVEAALVAAAPETTQTLLLEAEVLTFRAGPIQKQHLTVYANDEVVYQDDLANDRSTLRIKIPSSVWRNRRELIVRLGTPDFGIPRLLRGTTDDYRPISLGFLWMQWSILKDGSGSLANGSPAPYLATEGWQSATSEINSGYFVEGWRKYSDGVPRMSRRTARLRFSVLHPKSGGYLLSLRFEPESRSKKSILEVRADEGRSMSMDPRHRSSVDILLPHGSVANDGVVTVVFQSDLIPSAVSRGLKPNGPAGPGLKALRLQCVPDIANRPIFQPGEWIDFRKGRNGQPYLKWGWWPSEEEGTSSYDTIGCIEGLWGSRRIQKYSLPHGCILLV